MAYFAEIDTGTNRVLRVVVAPSSDWCVANLGGAWAATSDPYTDDGDPVVYCGPGYGHDPGVVERFCSVDWDATLATTQQQDEDGNWFWTHNTQGELVFHNGKIWRNLMPSGTPNVWEPPINWREYPMGATHPLWVQPTGAIDAYPVDFWVEHNAGEWINVIPANTFEPGVAGWRQQGTLGLLWSQPSGAADAYQTGDIAEHNGLVWQSLVDNNTWEPGAVGSESLWLDVTAV